MSTHARIIIFIICWLISGGVTWLFISAEEDKIKLKVLIGCALAGWFVIITGFIAMIIYFFTEAPAVWISNPFHARIKLTKKDEKRLDYDFP